MFVMYLPYWNMWQWAFVPWKRADRTCSECNFLRLFMHEFLMWIFWGFFPQKYLSGKSASCFFFVCAHVLTCWCWTQRSKECYVHELNSNGANKPVLVSVPYCTYQQCIFMEINTFWVEFELRWAPGFWSDLKFPLDNLHEICNSIVGKSKCMTLDLQCSLKLGINDPFIF